MFRKSTKARLVGVIVAALLLTGGFASTASATVIEFTFTTTVTTDGVAGVSNGNILTLVVSADNGTDGSGGGFWAKSQVLSSIATVGTYEATFTGTNSSLAFPFETNASGEVISAGYTDNIDGGFHTDSFAGGFNIELWFHQILTSNDKTISFSGDNSNVASAWTANIPLPAAVPEPSTLALFIAGLVLLGFFGFGGRRTGVMPAYRLSAGR